MTLRIAALHIRRIREHNPEFQHELDLLNQSMIQQINALGHTADLVATAEVPAELVIDAVDRADAVVIMGGEDVYPALYHGAQDYPGSGQHEEFADRAQIAAIHRALELRKPLLGICRGLQLLNVALGGTLIQHLPNSDQHRSTGTDPFVTTRLNFLSRQLVGDIRADEAHLCTHHQAIDMLGVGLRVAAVSTDGVIEAVMHDSAPVTAVQWHPEHPGTASSQLRALLLRLQRQVVREPAAV